MAMRRLWAIGILGSLFLMASSADAAVPKLINYSGKIVDKSGNLLGDGTYDMKFTIYSGQSGPAIWWESHLNANGQGVSVRNGAYSVVLGGISPLGDTSTSFSSDYYLEMQFYNPAPYSTWETFAKQQLLTVPYSMRAEYANQIEDNTISTNKIVNGSVTGVKIQSGTVLGGNIGSNTITAANIANGTITGNKIAPLAITGSNINNGTIVNGNIAPNAVDQLKANFAPVVWKYPGTSGDNPKIIYGQTTSDSGGGYTINISGYGFTQAPIFVASSIGGIVSFVFGNASTTQVIGSTHNSGGAPTQVTFNWVLIGR
jgi:hypothetical protein